MMTEKKFKMREGMYRLDVKIYNFDCLNCTSVTISVDVVYVNPLTENKEIRYLGYVNAEVTDDNPVIRHRWLKAIISKRLKSLASDRIIKRIFKEVSALIH